jgi:hypothetical protein
MQTSGTYRVQAVLDSLPLHGFDLVTVTLPKRLVRMKSNAMVASKANTSPSLRRPTSPFDAAIEWTMRIPYVRRLYRELALPDTLGPWARYAAHEAAEHLHDIDCIYATAPPYAAMTLADRLAGLLDVPLVQEVRDPPSFDRAIKSRSRSFQRRMRRWEEEHLARADAVIALTPTMRTRLLDLHGSIRPGSVHVVPNGYPVITPRPEMVARDQDVFTLVYTGTFLHGGRNNPLGPFNPGVLGPHLLELGVPFDLRVAGSQSPQQERALRRTSGENLTLLGEISRQQAISEIAAADVALIVADDDDWWIGRKVFEYLAYARRILAILPPGDTSDLLSGSPKATVVGIGQGQGLTHALRELYEEWVGGDQPPPGGPRIDSDPESVERIAQVLRSVIVGAERNPRGRVPPQL